MRKKFLSTQTVSLNEFLKAELCKVEELASHEVSNSKIRRLIVAGCVSVNGRTVTRPGFELRGKSIVECDIDIEKFFFEKQPDDIDFTLTEKDVLFEDEYIICVNKPAFLPVEQTIVGNRKNLHDCVVDYLWKKNPSFRNPPYVGIMHRLDRETSGVILFTKQRVANKSIFEQFEKHTITKTYIAVACGKPVKDFTVENTIGRISAKSQAAKWGSLPESRGGLYAKTAFSKISGVNVKGASGDFCLVHCELFTGRTHQIRVHLSEKGLPLLGDTLYGGKDFKRIMLHSDCLVFKHPVSGEEMTVRAGSPDFNNL
ncbi:MAG: RluA family pseudouridine synthase [Treponema sp.]|nr:RluA family pseudouridine synthase [Treponema sp.]